MARQGVIDSPPKTPFIMGTECAGEIEQVGEGVENFKVCSLTTNRKRKKTQKYNSKNFPQASSYFYARERLSSGWPEITFFFYEPWVAISHVNEDWENLYRKVICNLDDENDTMSVHQNFFSKNPLKPLCSRKTYFSIKFLKKSLLWNFHER